MSDSQTNDLEQIDALLGVAETPEKESAEPEMAETEQLAADEPEVEEQGDESAPEPETTAIDYELEIPMPDGRDAMSLGALKDKVIELDRSEQQLVSRENDIMRQSDELAQAIHSVGGKVPPELQKQMEKRQTEHLQREHEAMFKAIPEWSDKQTFEKDREAIAETASTYGISPEELSGIMDHRMIKVFHDITRLTTAQAKAKQTKAEVHQLSQKQGRRKPSNRNQADKAHQAAIRSKDHTVKLDAIDKLLSG